MAPGNADMSLAAPSKTQVLIDVKCRKCNKVVRNGVLCASCDKWIHFKCGNVDVRQLPDDNSPWVCPRCTSEDNGEDEAEKTDQEETLTLAAIVDILKKDIERLKNENQMLRTVSNTSTINTQFQYHPPRSVSMSSRGWESVPKRNSGKHYNTKYDIRNSNYPPLDQRNRFSPLSNLDYECETPKSINKQQRPLANNRPKPVQKSKPTSYFVQPRSRPKHSVKIYSDSFGRGLSKLVKDNLSNKVEVDGLVKSSATLKQVVPMSEYLLNTKNVNSLSTNDVVVIIGGANDIYTNNTPEAETSLKKALDSLSNTNVVYVNVPHRFDLHHDSDINREIAQANQNFKEICKSYKNVSLVNTSSCDRSCHTVHGQHFSFKGKRTLANLISKIVKNRLSLVRNSPEQGNA